MPGEKRFLQGKCQEPGCNKRARHLRGTADIRVAWVDYTIKAFCGQHTRDWDQRKQAWKNSLGADNPNHLFPGSSLLMYELRAERLAAEQETTELARRNKLPAPRRRELESIRSQNARQPRVVRLI